MGVAETALVITAITTAATAGTAAYQQNRGVKRAQRAQTKAALAEQQQLSKLAAQGLQRRRFEGEAVRKRIRVAAGEAGSDLSGSFAALATQSVYDEIVNVETLKENFSIQQKRVQAGLEADLSRLEMDKRNPLLAALTGALGGVGTGLQIGGLFTSVGGGGGGGTVEGGFGGSPYGSEFT